MDASLHESLACTGDADKLLKRLLGRIVYTKSVERSSKDALNSEPKTLTQTPD